MYKCKYTHKYAYTYAYKIVHPAGEVANPSKTYPFALYSSVAACVLSYIFPLLIASGVDPNWLCWTDGSLASVALLVIYTQMNEFIMLHLIIDAFFNRIHTN